MESRCEQAKRLRKEGKKYREIAKIMGLRHVAIHKYLSYIPSGTKRGRKQNPENRVKIKNLREEGLSWEKIGKAIGLTRQRVHQIAVELGICNGRVKQDGKGDAQESGH